MTLMEKMDGGQKRRTPSPKAKNASTSSDLSTLNHVESQLSDMMQQFRLNNGFSVDTGVQPADTMVEIMAEPGVVASIACLLSYIRFCINHQIKQDITVKIGYNKPAELPMNFAVNEELLGEVYPSATDNTIEIN